MNKEKPPPIMRVPLTSTIGGPRLGADWTAPGAGSCTRRQMKSGVEEEEEP